MTHMRMPLLVASAGCRDCAHILSSILSSMQCSCASFPSLPPSLFPRQDIAFGIGLRRGDDDFNVIEVVPVRRYESHKVAIKVCGGRHLTLPPCLSVVAHSRHRPAVLQGSLRCEAAGTYVLIFDNSFSKLTSKRVTFYADVKDEQQVEPPPELSGWLLKHKKTRGLQRAYSRRWFTLQQGQLSYFKNPNSYCRGTIDVAQSTVTVSVRPRIINIDNGQLLFHLKGARTRGQPTIRGWQREEMGALFSGGRGGLFDQKGLFERGNKRRCRGYHVERRSITI